MKHGVQKPHHHDHVYVHREMTSSDNLKCNTMQTINPMATSSCLQFWEQQRCEKLPDTRYIITSTNIIRILLLKVLGNSSRISRPPKIKYNLTSQQQAPGNVIFNPREYTAGPPALQGDSIRGD
jgi:hypothetical protein